MLKPSILFAAFSLGCFMLVPLRAAAQSSGSAQVVATCKDGSTFTGKSRKGACRGHGGVASFQETPATPPAPAGSNSMSPAKPSAMAPMAAGGGAGKVWVNTDSKIYHCPGDRYYGKTKKGEYMSESAAVAAGDKPDHGKACK